MADANPPDEKKVVNPRGEGSKFPYTTADKQRIAEYQYHDRLFHGNHFDAFRIKIKDPQYTKAYEQLRYITVNFAGLISKVVADMLFSEPVVPKVPDGDQEYVDGLWEENKMNAQVYEAALSNSYNGDALFKVRVGKRQPTDKEETVIIEENTPKVYYPKLDPFNARAQPTEQELAWKFSANDKDYVRKEIHKVGTIKHEAWLLEGDELKSEVDISILGENAPEEVEEETLIDRPVIIHLPNWKTGDRYFGISDYHDLDSLFYGVNNRMTKIDNILDLHSDPLLMLPEGLIDEKGNVSKKHIGVIEVKEGETGKPEYIVWDASLEAAFKEIEKIVDFMYLIGEISPDILGLGQGKSESGRALKFKLLRTIAKVARKKLYFDIALKETMYVAQLIGKEWNIKVKDKAIAKEPVVPELDWNDGLPRDEVEETEVIGAATDIGIMSKKDGIKRFHSIDDKAAEEMAKEIDEEKKAAMPEMKLGENPFAPAGEEDEDDDKKKKPAIPKKPSE